MRYAVAMTFSELSLGLERRAYAVLARRVHGRSKLPRHLITGIEGEDAAYFHLRRFGYTVVARRWRSEKLPSDLDLVAWDGDTLVFFEVKTRTARDMVTAGAAVDRHKERMLRRMASAYLRQFPERYRASIPVR
ncbi:MAG: YraN family protein, partial [Bryocella sp.]